GRSELDLIVQYRYQAHLIDGDHFLFYDVIILTIHIPSACEVLEIHGEDGGEMASFFFQAQAQVCSEISGIGERVCFLLIENSLVLKGGLDCVDGRCPEASRIDGLDIDPKYL